MRGEGIKQGGKYLGSPPRDGRWDRYENLFPKWSTAVKMVVLIFLLCVRRTKQETTMMNQNNVQKVAILTLGKRPCLNHVTDFVI